MMEEPTRRHSPLARSSTPAPTACSSRACVPILGPAPLLSATPALSLARWICAIDPDAIGLCSTHTKMSASCCAPYARSSIRSVHRQLCSGAPACSSSSSLHSLAGNTSYRVLAHCPHLMNAAPASSSVCRSSRYQMAAPPSHCRSTGARAITGEKRMERCTARIMVSAFSSMRPKRGGRVSTHVAAVALTGTTMWFASLSPPSCLPAPSRPPLPSADPSPPPP
mmetsp:Transcript_24949/g.62220  ORF Transcript_24949/g.62220 Transcript_24949/m.62220 type:complete len:224 (-) Transcript_24949:1124-1795(-)